MRIQPLGKNHVKQIIFLENQHAPDEPMYSRYSEHDLNFLFEHPNTCAVFGLFDQKTLIGWGSYRTNWKRHQQETEEYEISSILISKDYRRTGIGGRLLNHLISSLKQIKGVNRVFITVSPHNIAALILYLKHGFTIYDFKPNVYGPGADRVYLELSLKK